MLSRALESQADSLVLDLEDSVPLESKDSARQEIARWLREHDFGGKERIVRINGLDTPYATLDLEATVPTRPDAFLVPKLRSPAELRELDAQLTRLEWQHGMSRGAIVVIPIATETPQGLLCVAELARQPRVDAITWGAEDLSAALGARRNRDARGEYLEVFRHARIMTLLSAAAAGIDAIDGVYVDFRDREGLERETLSAAEQGFGGKMTIHPDQIAVVNRLFTPSDAEIAECRELLEVCEVQRASGTLAFAFRGQMVDAPHIERARRLLARAERSRTT